MKQYKFTAKSALSFAVTHNGRQMYVTFSPAYRGLSFFITTDENLAKKIRLHRWFRDGRINEQIVDIQPAKEEKAYQPVMPPQPKKYSILGKPMATTKPAAAQHQPEQQIPERNPAQEETPSFVADEVTSFMEAKEFFITKYGVQRSEVTSKDAIAQLCKDHNVTFPNYPM